MDRYSIYSKSGESSQRRERARREKVKKERSTRKTIQAREKFRTAMKSHDTLCFLFFVFFWNRFGEMILRGATPRMSWRHFLAGAIF